MEQKKMLIGAIALVVVLAAVWFLFFSQPSFEAEYARMAESWKSQGVECEILHGCEELFSASGSELDSINRSLTQFNSPNQAATDISLVYTPLVSSAKSLKRIGSLREEIDLGGEICEQVDSVKQIGSEFSNVREQRDAYIEKINSFWKSHPDEAALISLHADEAPEPESEQQLLLLITMAELLGGECE